DPSLPPRRCAARVSANVGFQRTHYFRMNAAEKDRESPSPPRLDQSRHEMNRVALFTGHFGHRAEILRALAKFTDRRTRDLSAVRRGKVSSRNGQSVVQPIEAQQQVDQHLGRIRTDGL